MEKCTFETHFHISHNILIFIINQQDEYASNIERLYEARVRLSQVQVFSLQCQNFCDDIIGTLPKTFKELIKTDTFSRENYIITHFPIYIADAFVITNWCSCTKHFKIKDKK